MRRESGGRLLPAGVIRVEGVFASHQAVRLIVRRKRRSVLTSHVETDSHPPSPKLNPNSSSTTGSTVSFLSLQATTSESSITTYPTTPSIQPALSLSSSIASLDPLNRSSNPASPGLQHQHATTMTTSGADLGVISEGVSVALDWEEVEIGKGLAQYNSSEIDRVKGMKRCVRSFLSLSFACHSLKRRLACCI